MNNRFQLTNRIGTMAVVMDEAQAITEMLNVDSIGIATLELNPSQGMAIFHLVFGGYDSKGRFHIDRKREAARIAVTREQTPDLFDQLLCDGEAVKLGFDRDFWVALLRDMFLPAATMEKGPWMRYKDMEVTHDGVVIFPKGLHAVKTAV